MLESNFLTEAKSFAKNFGSMQSGCRRFSDIKILSKEKEIVVFKVVGVKPGYMGFIYVVVKKGKKLKYALIDTFHKSWQAEIKKCELFLGKVKISVECRGVYNGLFEVDLASLTTTFTIGK